MVKTIVNQSNIIGVDAEIAEQREFVEIVAVIPGVINTNTKSSQLYIIV